MPPLRLLLLLPLLGVAAPAARAQAPDTAVVLSVTPDHADWLYALGDSAHFSVALTRGGRPIPGVRVRVQVGPERMPADRVDTLLLAAGRARVSGAMRAPGFLRAIATAEVEGRSYTAMATAGFSPEGIEAATPMPPDLMEFWRGAIAEARRVPLESVMTRMPDRSTKDVDVYHVSFQNQRVGSRLYGILSVPTAPGKYPAMLVVPGAGVRPYFPAIGIARRGVIHLAIGIHGIPVDRDSLLYNELRATALQQYWRYGVEDRDLYYYKRVFVGVVRAGDFLLSLPQWDGEHYVVQGGSQGGGLAMVAGALDPRVDAIAVSYPAMSDQFGYFAGRAGGWPHMFADTAGMKALPEKMATIPYYDGVNFARMLRIPGIYAWGFNDPTVPPTASFATYNAVTAPKEKLLSPPNGHNRAQWQSDRMDEWLMRQMGVRATPR